MIELNRYFDSTILKPDAVYGDIKSLCEEAVREDFYSVCVNPAFVPSAHSIVTGTNTLVATVIGFPLGQNQSEVKAFEAALAMRQGANECDMVMNVSALKDKAYDFVLNDIRSVVKATHDQGGIVKVILETCLLKPEEIRTASLIAMDAGADFVKTSTGFSTGGATPEAVEIMAAAVGGKLGIKASGGIRTLDTALLMIDKGATRLGCSSCKKIMDELRAKTE